MFSRWGAAEAVRKVRVRAVCRVARRKEVRAHGVPLRHVSVRWFLQLVTLEERSWIMFQTWRLLRRRPVRRRSERQTALSLHCDAPSARAARYQQRKGLCALERRRRFRPCSVSIFKWVGFQRSETKSRETRRKGERMQRSDPISQEFNRVEFPSVQLTICRQCARPFSAGKLKPACKCVFWQVNHTEDYIIKKWSHGVSGSLFQTWGDWSAYKDYAWLDCCSSALQHAVCSRKPWISAVCRTHIPTVKPAAQPAVNL